MWKIIFFLNSAQKIKPEINRLSSVPSTSWVSTLIQLLSLIEKGRRRRGRLNCLCVFAGKLRRKKTREICPFAHCTFFVLEKVSNVLLAIVPAAKRLFATYIFFSHIHVCCFSDAMMIFLAFAA